MNTPAGKHAQRRQERGFTLIEVAVSSLIMLTGMLAAAQLFVIATAFNQSSRKTTMSTMLAQRKIEQLLALPMDDAALAWQGSTGANGRPQNGKTEDYYLDMPHEQRKGTGKIMAAPFFDGQEPSYNLTWVVEQDTGVPPMPGLRRITVRVEATQAALTGMGVQGGGAAAEAAQISTIRTPPQ